MKNVSGFTLIELLLAAAVLVVALGGLLHLFNYCLALSIQATNTVNATTEAYSKLEQIRLENYGGIYDKYKAGESDHTFDLKELIGTGTVTPSYVSGTNNELLQVSVTASYKEKGGRTLNLSLMTLIAKRY
ncbi:MAG: prepilin-type N-terminal cleavage/methylation domain-containing protein [Candidatus Omnitrophota bacterium]|nr:MAG: prepilin-type N-terminal cleavage/methylation domain-containing protein [Candidatus Omnitrophota bacterium]